MRPVSVKQWTRHDSNESVIPAQCRSRSILVSIRLESRGLPDRSVNTFDEYSKTPGFVRIFRQISTNSSGPGDLLIGAPGDFHQFVERIAYRIGNPIGPLVSIPNQIRNTESEFDCGQVTEVPTLQLTTDDPDKCLGLSCGPARAHKFPFERRTVACILIAQHDENRVGRTPATQSASEMLFEVLSPFENYICDVGHSRKHTGEEPFQHFTCRRLLQTKHDRHALGSAPLKNPCFHKYPI